MTSQTKPEKINTAEIKAADIKSSDMKTAEMKAADINETQISPLKNIKELNLIDPNLPINERLTKIKARLGNPYLYISSCGVKVKINHSGIKKIDEAILEHLIKNSFTE
jgi:hypothetical protein